jgi:hypothetical protein
MATAPIDVGPPNSGPEPPGFAAAVASRIFGRGTPGGTGQPDAYDLIKNPQAALDFLKKTREFCDPGREVFEQGWWRAIMYLLGRQWIYWNPTSRTFQDVRQAIWIPKPVTNKVRETLETVLALLSDISPGIDARPVGQQPRNVLTAQVANDIAPLIHDEHQMDLTLVDADYWAALLGSVFLHPHWDKDDPRNIRVIQLDQCQTCQAIVKPDQVQEAQGRCPSCGGGQLRPAMKPDGTPVTEKLVLGRGRTIVASPLELLIPLYASNFERVDRLIHLDWRPRHELEAELGSDITKRIQWTKDPQQRSLQLYRSLAVQSDLPITPQQWNSAANMGDVEGATEQLLWVRPNTVYEQGVFLRFIGEGDSAILIESPLPGGRPEIPYKNFEGTALWPWVHYPYSRIGGRLYGQSCVDMILGKQDQINRNDSSVMMAVNRMGNAVWLEPKGAEIERLTGQQGLVIKYQSIGSQGAKPERLSGENPPEAFFKLRQQYMADIEDGAGTYDVVKGAKPSGIEAFSALQLLVERSQSRFTKVFKSRGTAYRQWFEVALELDRKHGPSERVREVLGPNGGWIFKTFQKAKLDGPVKIVIEDGSNVPKTALGRRAAIEHANQLGLIDPRNPDQLYHIMQELGLTALVPALDADVKSALQEQQAFEDWAGAGYRGNPPLMRMPWHNDDVHAQENRKWMNSDRMREILAAAPPDVGMMLVQFLGDHLMQHEQAILAKMQLQAEAQGPGPGGPGGGAPGGTAGGGRDGGGRGAGRAARNSNQESGKPGGGADAGRAAA